MASAESAPVTKMIGKVDGLAQVTGDLHPVHAGQAGVDEGEVGLQGLGGFEGGGPVGHRTDLVAVVLQDRHQELTGRGLVVDHQHVNLSHGHPLTNFEEILRVS
jgi:hypothetical protein